MKTLSDTVTTRIEASVLQFFSPYGLLCTVALILLSVLIFTHSTTEMRTHEGPAVESRQIQSPMLETTR
ncbi:hypothetical protein DESC_730090 [Desulfosarcina cetonica]|uniref:hypothetical protein n=1 Tax=Desulfosarcina cetonica TaxID=90730 RepID=UPI0006D13CE0|nr:hypothetical protein [Desulfosarcina cetonica]VTR69210.1 hypothetical protein DESC_730090 [Desulfosarcina cetonica]